MKVIGLFFGIFVLLVTGIDAQRSDPNQRPDFSGQWIMDHDKTVDRGQAGADELRRKDYAKQNLTRKVTRALNIVHKDAILEITQQSTVEVSDRGGNVVEKKNNIDFSLKLSTNDEWEERMASAEVKTRWKGDQIESTLRADTEVSLVRVGAEGAFAKTTRTGYLVRTYQVSRDGNELIVETVDRAFDGEGIHPKANIVRWVYKRMN